MGWMIQVLVLSIGRDFSFLQNAKTGHGAHPASVNGLLSPMGKVARV